MSEENEDIGQEDLEDGVSEEQEEQESSSESEVGSESEEQASEVVNNEAVQKAIDRQHRKFRDEERRRMELEKELEENRAKLAQYEKDTSEIVVPPMPDQWDEDYDEKIRIREAALVKKAQADYDKQAKQDADFRAQQEAQLKAQQAQQEMLEGYAKRAEEQGIKEQDLIVAANRVADIGVDPAIATFLLTDKDGPLITAYLADSRNTVELHEIATMSPVAFGEKIAELRQKSTSLRKNSSDAPPPVDDVVNSGGKPDLENRPMIAGAKFE